MGLRPMGWLRLVVGLAAVCAAFVSLSPLSRRGRRANVPVVRAGNPRHVLLITIDTLRADHVGAYGYARPTTPAIDALAARGVLFEQAFTFWPKTRASMIAMLTGLYPSRNGYDQAHRDLYDFNPTLASVLHEAGYATSAFVDNANVARDLGFGKGFETFYEAWSVAGRTEADNARAITDHALRFLARPQPRPFFLWLHYVNPHAPYTPPSPYDTLFDGPATSSGPDLHPVVGFHGGLPRRWAVPGQSKLGYYVARYDGEVTFVDAEVGRVLQGLASSGLEQQTVVVLTSDHGESLGEHEYYFDHGEDLFDPCLRVPLVIAAPEAGRGRRVAALASTLDVVPTILDTVKVRYPPDLAGVSLLEVAMGGAVPERERLFAENDRGLVGTHDGRFKLVATPGGAPVAASTQTTAGAARLALYDRAVDPVETNDRAAAEGGEAARQRAALDAYLAERSVEWETTRQRLRGGNRLPTCDACLRLLQLGYVDSCPEECQASR